MWWEHDKQLRYVETDAVPKKRGPKTDANVLEALLKRFDGLEKKLQHDKSLPTTLSPTTPTLETPIQAATSTEGPNITPVERQQVASFNLQRPE